MATIDRLYRSILVAARFFSKGWGPTHAYECVARFNPILVDRVECAAALEPHRHSISLHQTAKASWGSVLAGSFLSPLATLFPDLLPSEARVARFELLVPPDWKMEYTPTYIHLAGTGDHGFHRRRRMTALPLLKKEGLAAVILENPYYGSRKPLDQTLSQLLHVSDLFVMGLALMLECLVLREWLEEEGMGPVGITGASMGGHNASLSASVWPEAVPVVPFLSWSTASSVFSQGMLSGALCWDVLEDQLLHTRTSSDKIRKKIFDLAVEKRASLMEKKGSTCALVDRKRCSSSPSHSHMTDSTVMMTSTVANRDNSPPEFSPQHNSRASFLANTTSIAAAEPSASCVCHHSWMSTKRSREKSSLHQETVLTLEALLDLSTHLQNYPVPVDPSLAQFVVAQQDLYIPRQHIAHVQDTWPGCEVRYVKGGHVTATIFQQQTYHSVLVTKMLERLAHPTPRNCLM